jgi:pimeloyl-ACP methyl ester carboxylesterase
MHETTRDINAYRTAERRFWMRTVGFLPTEEYIELPGLGSRVRVLSHGVGPTLLFLHGGPSAASTWAPLVKRLPHFRSVLIERPGTGLSELPTKRPNGVRPYAVQMVNEALDALDIEQAEIVASSFGSYAALAFALVHPERVSRMVHLGAPALVPGTRVPLPLLMQSLPVVSRLLRRMQPASSERSQRTLIQMGHDVTAVKGADFADYVRWYTALVIHTTTRANDQTLFSQIRPHDFLSPSELASLHIPMSFLWGARDTFGGAAAARSLSEMIPNASLELLDDSGHLPWLDAPERAAAHVISFMREVRRRGRRGSLVLVG